MPEEFKKKRNGLYSKWVRKTTSVTPEFKPFNRNIAPSISGEPIRLSCVWGGRLRIFRTPDKWGKVYEGGTTIGRLISDKGIITQYNKEVLTMDIEGRRGVPKIGFNQYVIENMQRNSLVLVKLYGNSAKTKYKYYFLTAGEILEKGSDDVNWKGKGHEKKLMVRVEDFKPLVIKWNI